MTEFKKRNINEQEMPSTNFKEAEFKDAMAKRQDYLAFDLMKDILSEDRTRFQEQGGNIFNIDQNDLDPSHLEMARKFALKYFEHKKSLDAILRLYELFDCRINIVPEAQEANSELHKAIKSEYEQALTNRVNNFAYELGKIGGFLDKDEYKKIFDIAVDKNDVGAAYKYAMEGKLFNTSDPQIKSWIDECGSVSKRRSGLIKKRTEEDLSLIEFKDKYGNELKSLDKRTKDIKELLVASVE